MDGIDVPCVFIPEITIPLGVEKLKMSKKRFCFGRRDNGNGRAAYSRLSRLSSRVAAMTVESEDMIEDKKVSGNGFLC